MRTITVFETWLEGLYFFRGGGKSLWLLCKLSIREIRSKAGRTIDSLHKWLSKWWMVLTGYNSDSEDEDMRVDLSFNLGAKSMSAHQLKPSLSLLIFKGLESSSSSYSVRLLEEPNEIKVQFYTHETLSFYGKTTKALCLVGSKILSHKEKALYLTWYISIFVNYPTRF